MLAQVIFFSALALLLILLLRRAHLSGSWPTRLSGAAMTLSRMLYFTGTRLGGTLVEQARRASGFSRGSGEQGSGLRLPTQGEADFWGDERLSDKPEIRSHFEEGDALFREGKLKEAEHFFLKAATTKPNDPKIYGRLGLIYLQNKNYNDAIEAFKVSVKLDKYNPARHFNLALAYRGNKDKQRSIASVREAISLDPITKKYRQFLEQLLESK